MNNNTYYHLSSTYAVPILNALNMCVCTSHKNVIIMALYCWGAWETEIK